MPPEIKQQLYDHLLNETYKFAYQLISRKAIAYWTVLGALDNFKGR
jgi:hypothetical protein